MKLCKIMRGLPGSGKSHYVKQHFPNAYVFSADHFHMVDGEYKFNPKNARKAHNLCWQYAYAAMNADHPLVVIDNTNISAWEASPYVKLAEVFGYEYEILHMDTPLDVCLQRQTHGVPLNKMVDMYCRLQETFPPWWPLEIVAYQE